MSLFEGFICRVGGLPTNNIEELRFNKTKEIMFKYKSLFKCIESEKESISNDLYKHISNNEDKSKKNKILKFKRDLFKLKFNNYLKIKDLLSSDLIESIENLKKLIEEKESIILEIKNSYEYELPAIRQKFKIKIKNEDFQKGLLISSKVLFNSQEYYQNSDNTNLNRKQEQIERGLLRYYSRMVMKATPFGTFCSIIPGSITSNYQNGNQQKDQFRFTNIPTSKESIILINKGLYENILNFITENNKIKLKLTLELNQTIKLEKEKIKYLTAIQKNEIFQKLDNNEVLNLFIHEFESNSAIVYEKLISLMCVHPELEATKEEAEGYIDKLIEIGFLRFKIGIPEQQVDWVDPLINILKVVQVEEAYKIISLLQELKKKINLFKNSNLDNRAELLTEMDLLVKNSFKELDIKSNLKVDLPFYEDSTSNSSVEINFEGINDIAILLNKFILHTRKIAYPRTEQASMRKFFNDYYEENSSVPLLDFYENFYRSHFKEHLEKQNKIHAKVKDEEVKKYNVSNPFDLEVIKSIQEGHNKIMKLIIKKWNEDQYNDIDLRFDEIKEAIKDVPELSSKPNSSSLFSQLVLSDRENKLIIPKGKYLLGYGKYFSRFLRLFPDNEQDLLFEKNNSLSNCILAEISGDDNFNANLHPPLTEYEISYPTSEVGMANKQIKCTDIVVEENHDDQYSLVLKCATTRKEIIPLDLGFLNPMMRPPLFQLLSKFTPPSSFSINIPESKIIQEKKDVKNNIENTENGSDIKNKENIEENKLEIIYRPRVTFEEKLVLSRRCWIIPKDLFPFMENNETNLDYFLKVNKWISENKIPNEVYIKIKPLPLNNKKKDSSQNENDKNKNNDQAELNLEKIVNEKNVNDDDNKENENGLDKKSEEVNKGPDKTDTTKKKTKISRDFYKPQYIDFQNPLFVNLFGKTIVNLQNFNVTIEERYPTNSELPNFKGEKYSTEQIFQMDYTKIEEEINEEEVLGIINEK